MGTAVNTETKKIAGCEIRSCICKHTFQDETYGKSRRVMNACQGGYRCTVCGASASKETKPEPAKAEPAKPVAKN